MTRLLVRNKVQDFDTWKAVFDADQPRANTYGLRAESVWQTVEDPNEVFFVLTVESIDRANEFMAAPESAQIGERAGAVDGEFWFVE